MPPWSKRSFSRCARGRGAFDERALASECVVAPGRGANKTGPSQTGGTHADPRTGDSLENGAARCSFEPFLGRRALIGVDFDQGTLMSQNVYLRITAEGRLFGLNSGDWTMLVGGFALVALVVLLL
jgi:hypothetical protein